MDIKQEVDDDGSCAGPSVFSTLSYRIIIESITSIYTPLAMNLYCSV